MNTIMVASLSTPKPLLALKPRKAISYTSVGAVNRGWGKVMKLELPETEEYVDNREQTLAHLESFRPLEGGFVFASVHNIQANVPPENIIALFDAAREFAGGSLEWMDRRNL